MRPNHVYNAQGVYMIHIIVCVYMMTTTCAYLHREDRQGSAKPAVGVQLKVLQLRHTRPTAWYGAVQVVVVYSIQEMIC